MTAPDPAPHPLIEALGLEPHPEGGYFREVFRAERTVRLGEAPRTAMTSIYFLLDAGQHSRWHRVASDEVWHFLAGRPLDLVSYDPHAREVRHTVLGPVPGIGGPGTADPRGTGEHPATGDPRATRDPRASAAAPEPAGFHAAPAPVAVVPGGHWQAARPRAGDGAGLGDPSYSLVGCTVAPGFEFEDFQFVSELPEHEAAFDGPLAAYRELL